MNTVTISSTRPVLDWFETKEIEFDLNMYTSFRLQFRFGPSYWLIPTKKVDGQYIEQDAIPVNAADAIEKLGFYINRFECITTGDWFAEKLGRLLATRAGLKNHDHP